MTTTEDELRSRRVLKVNDVAAALNMLPTELRTLMAETGTPVLRLGKGHECLFIDQLDDILMSRSGDPIEPVAA